jgi:tripeptidyl-peptidase-1
MRRYRSVRARLAFSVVSVSGGQLTYNPANVGLVPSLEVQYTQAMAFPTLYVFYNTGCGVSGTDDWYLSWLEYIIRQPIIPQTILIPKGNHEIFYSRDYAEYVCGLLGHLGLLGVTVLIASGDNGVGQGNCIDRSGNVRFRPSFPATCTCGLFLSLEAVHKLRYG